MRKATVEELGTTTREVAELREVVIAMQAQPSAWLETVMTRRLIVHMTTDISLDGSLVAVMADGVLLRGARILNDGRPPTSLAGEVFIARDKIAFVQHDVNAPE